MNISIFIMLIVATFCVYMALRAGRGKNEQIEQWALAGRKMGAIITFSCSKVSTWPDLSGFLVGLWSGMVVLAQTSH